MDDRRDFLMAAMLSVAGSVFAARAAGAAPSARQVVQRDLPKVAGDATKLPFGDGVFDAVTISFGLRNVVDHSAGLREMARVTRPGGRLVVCEFSTPTNRVFATAYKEYLMQALPRIASAVSSNPDAYVYLAESIRAWPDQAELARRISDAGWSAVRWRNLTGGIVALHAATKPLR